jgi:hypothetical protein
MRVRDAKNTRTALKYKVCADLIQVRLAAIWRQVLELLGLFFIITAWSRVLLEKRTVLQLVKKFPAFYGTRMFITAFTSARHMFLS